MVKNHGASTTFVYGLLRNDFMSIKTYNKKMKLPIITFILFDLSTVFHSLGELAGI